MSDKQLLGAMLRLFRLQSNLTQEELGRVIGVPRSIISKWEIAGAMPTL